MSQTPSNEHDELMDERSIEAIRALGGTGRLRMVDELTKAARALMAARVRDQHKDWTDDQISAEVARRVRDAAA